MKVPFVDLKAQYNEIGPEARSAIMSVVEDCAFVGGKYVERFEEDFAAFCGRRYAVGVSSGTSALHLALVAMGIGPGDEIITAANTFIATTEAVTHAGAGFRLVEIDAGSFNIDPSLIEAAITERTKAIVPVHLYGQPADMDAVNEIADKHDLLVLEDAAQAQGAEYKGRRAGSMGTAAAFSFYPAKNLGAYGDAGIVVTDEKEIADRVRLYANHGRGGATGHAVEGFNARLDGIQAAVLGYHFILQILTASHQLLFTLFAFPHGIKLIGNTGLMRCHPVSGNSFFVNSDLFDPNFRLFHADSSCRKHGPG